MKIFLLGSKDKAETQSYIWYSIGGLLNACQSAILLFVISRTNSQDDAGVYTIGYAIACLALAVGNFGMRNFQATDTNSKYSFNTYLLSRIVTDVFMFVVILFYLMKGYFFLDYSSEKCLVILFLGLLKMVDSFEDVWHGLYQCLGRLDVAGKCMTVRYLIMMGMMTIGLVFSHNLVFSVIIAFIGSMSFFVISTILVFPEIKKEYNVKHEKKYKRNQMDDISNLMRECIVLFIGGFLALYIANAPKYAIDEIRSSAEQAIFGYIFMPVYLVNVLNTFIYHPTLSKMSSLFEVKEYGKFLNLFCRQIGIIIALVLMILIGGFLIGIPFLSFFYNTDLSDLKTPFMILLVGSGFLGIEGYLQAIITIMRKQNLLLIGFSISAILALILSRPAVFRFGIMGASVLYSGIIMLQMLVFITIFVAVWKSK